MAAKRKKRRKSQEDLLEHRWGMSFYELKRFKKKFGHCDVPATPGKNIYRSLGQWCQQQRQLKKFTPLKYSPDRARKLTELGFCWSILDRKFERKMRLLQEFQEKYGHCNVSYSDKNTKYSSLAPWARRIRFQYRTKNKVLTPGKIARLEKMRFQWVNPLKVGYGNLISDKELIKELKRLYVKCGRVPSTSYIDKYGKYAADTFAVHFGSMPKARKAAGLNPKVDMRKLTDEELLKELVRLSKELGRPASTKDMEKYGKHHSAVYRKRFGSIMKARKLAHLSYEVDRHHYTNEELLEDIRRVTKLIGKSPSGSDLDKHGKYAGGTYGSRLGGIAKARKKAGVNPALNRKKYSDEEMLQELKRVESLLDHSPSHSEILQHGKFSPKFYDKRFGGLRKARAMVGLPPPVINTQKCSDAELLEDLKRLARELRKMPTGMDVTKHGKYSMDSYYSHFGSINKARDLAGVNEQYSATL